MSWTVPIPPLHFKTIWKENPNFNYPLTDKILQWSHHILKFPLLRIIFKFIFILFMLLMLSLCSLDFLLIFKVILKICIYVAIFSLQLSRLMCCHTNVYRLSLFMFLYYVCVSMFIYMWEHIPANVCTCVHTW